MEELMEELKEGQVLLVYLRDAGPAQQAGVALESPRLETRFGDTFLVGQVPGNERDWAAGLEVLVRFLVFDSRKDYESRVETIPAYWELAEEASGRES
jgi:hypothetical protein